MRALETIIGLETHVQVSTKTKMFCACGNGSFGKPPNSVVCPVCMGHPGSLPVPNADAILRAARAALALGCTVASQCHFDRKNYFYPDLPAGFQISQYTVPLSSRGALSFSSGRETRTCRITRLHLENDAGKLVHRGQKTLCDYNRAGTPLMEIVTEPDLRSPMDARTFAEELRRLLIAVGASDADMYKGMMRFDASISLRPVGDQKLYPRAEVKNLNSFEALFAALTFEQTRQRKQWEEQGPPGDQITVGWDADGGKTEILREKETAADYRYFPEPDIPPLELSKAELAGLQSRLPPLPQYLRRKYLDLGLPESEVEMLIDQPFYRPAFDFVLEKTGDLGRARSLVLTQLAGHLKKLPDERRPGSEAILQLLGSLLEQSERGRIHRNQEKQMLEEMITAGSTMEELLARSGTENVGKEDVRRHVQAAMEANPHAARDFRSGKAQAASALVGWVMKETQGKADPRLIQRILQEQLRVGGEP